MDLEWGKYIKIIDKNNGSLYKLKVLENVYLQIKNSKILNKSNEMQREMHKCQNKDYILVLSNETVKLGFF